MRKTAFVRTLVLLFATGFLVLEEVDYEISAQARRMQEMAEPATPSTFVLFDLESPEGAPYPSDVWTVPDSSHNTGRRMNLPKPDCSEQPSACDDIDVINA